MKYPLQKIFDTRNNYKKIFWTHKIPTKAQDSKMGLGPQDPKWNATHKV